MPDFINSLNNSISGSIYVSTHDLKPGAACTFNGWIGQLSVQATDFSILAIGIATLLVVRGRTRLDSIPKITRILLCLSIWMMPLTSSTVVTGLGEMKPVSGNWCWISKDRPDLRYGFTHAWRILIIFITVCIYIYIYQYLSRHFRSLVMPSVLTKSTQKDEQSDWTWTNDPTKNRIDNSEPQTRFDNHHVELCIPVDGHGIKRPDIVASSTTRCQSHDDPNISSIYQYASDGNSEISHTRESQNLNIPRRNEMLGESENSAARNQGGSGWRRDSVETEIKRMLLLNGYPIMYVILWIPGLTNRALEASGRPSSSRVLAALQCSTQFVGFANAVTYGLNREMRKMLGGDLKRLFHKTPGQ